MRDRIANVLLPLRNVSGFNADTKGFAVTGTVPVREDITIQDPLWMFGTLQPQKDVTVTINGPMVAGMGQIFDLSEGGTIAGTPEVERVFPTWWGANPSGDGNSSPAINSAIAFCTGAYKPEVHHMAGLYRCMDSIRKPQSFSAPIIRGCGGGSENERAGTVWDFSQANLGQDSEGNAAPCFTFKGGSGQHCHGGISDIEIVGNGNTSGVRFEDQGGAFATNMTLIGHRDGVEFHNAQGFTEWNKVIGCQIHMPTRYAFRFRRSAGTESFHGAEIIDCWTNLSSSSPSAVNIGAGCKWYNGTSRLRVYFASGLSVDQYAFTAEAAKPGWQNYPLEIDGYLKCEGGNGHGVGSDLTIPYNFLGPIMSLTGMRYGGLRPRYHSMSLGPEAGGANGVQVALGQPMSFGPRYITVDAASGRWRTPVYCDGDVMVTMIVKCANYEFRLNGIARTQGYGAPGRYTSLDVWPVNDSRGFGGPGFDVDQYGSLWLTNKKYPPGEVQFYVWYMPLSLNIQRYLRYATMAD